MAEGNALIMPKLGLTMIEGLLAEWRVKPGDMVATGQTLFIVETDKIATEIEATGEGVIVDLVVAAGATVPVGVAVAYWTGGSSAAFDEPARPLEQVEATAVAQVTSKPPSPPSARIVASPLARRTATARAVDLNAVTGSGARGRIMARDIEAVSAARDGAANSARARDIVAPGSVRRAIAARLALSKPGIPHFHVTANADMGALDRLRAELNADAALPRLTVTPFLVAAAARALAARPELNAVWRDEGIDRLEHVNVGVAVDAPGGVRLPVVTNAARLDLDSLTQSIDAAVARAKEGRSIPADRQVAAISVSNVGMFGVASLTPIIDAEQSFILGVGAPQHVFRPDDGGLPVACREITLTLACDHRLADGADGARLLGAIVELIEHPLRLLRTGSPRAGPPAPLRSML